MTSSYTGSIPEPHLFDFSQSIILGESLAGCGSVEGFIMKQNQLVIFGFFDIDFHHIHT